MEYNYQVWWLIEKTFGELFLNMLWENIKNGHIFKNNENLESSMKVRKNYGKYEKREQNSRKNPQHFIYLYPQFCQ